MRCAELTESVRGTQPESHKGVIHLPTGLLGFEQVKHYILVGAAEEAPFMWLQMVEEPKLSFLVVEPVRIVADYRPDISDADAEFVGLQQPEDALILNIATLHPDGTMTVNLKGPIVVNRYTLVGKQVIPSNAGQYSLRHAVAAIPAAA